MFHGEIYIEISKKEKTEKSLEGMVRISVDTFHNDEIVELI